MIVFFSWAVKAVAMPLVCVYPVMPAEAAHSDIESSSPYGADYHEEQHYGQDASQSENTGKLDHGLTSILGTCECCQRSAQLLSGQARLECTTGHPNLP